MTSQTRLILCIASLGYLAADLFVIDGPINRWIESTRPDSPRSIARAKEQGVVARVNFHPITQSQLDRAIHERLWLEGKKFSTLPPDQQTAVRRAALEDLIDHELLRIRTSQTGQPPVVSEEEVNERIRRLVGRFETKGALETAMKTQGIQNENELRRFLTARIQQEKFLESETAQETSVSEEEAKKWFDENQANLGIPERIEARHIFLPTLDQVSDEVKAKLDAAFTALNQKQKDFATLAKELSDDPATKDIGGNLGWMTRDRLPRDFAEPVFALPLNQPKLIRTKIGWHLIEVTDRKPAETRSFEDAKPEIIAALEAMKRRHAIGEFRRRLRENHPTQVEILDPF
jgi:parvulin-like peptidyl-prolyl isomerase